MTSGEIPAANFSSGLRPGIAESMEHDLASYQLQTATARQELTVLTDKKRAIEAAMKIGAGPMIVAGLIGSIQLSLVVPKIESAQEAFDDNDFLRAACEFMLNGGGSEID